MTTLSQDLLHSLHDSASLRDLFQQLGYTPISQTRYSAQTLDWPDNIASELRGRAFEVIAEVDQGVFQIMLLEGDLALGLQRRLYRTLAERLSEGLLVLINESRDLLDLILLVDTRSEAERDQNLPLMFPRWNFDPRAVRPHQQRALEMLDVTGVAGPDVGLHMLRAFKRAAQETLFRSQGFISSYYLEQRITDDPDVAREWADLLPQMLDLRVTIADALSDSAGDAAQRLLVALGWERIAGSSAASGTAVDRLCVDGVAGALLVVLPPDAPLEQSLTATANPSYPQLALIAALEQQKQQNGLSWGILTNGSVWRLYSTLSSSISGVYYEIDLRDMLHFGDDRDLRYFAGFFSSAALLPLGQQAPFVERVFYASQTLAQRVGEDLKQIVFARVFPELANGIAADLRRRGLYTGTIEQRQLIFRATLILLYRTLFLLYAESRRLLPTMHPTYYPHSLTRLLTDIALRPFFSEYRRKPLDATSSWAWDWLNDMFAAVNGGKAAWGVPRYNGGLFSTGDRSTDPHKAPHRLLSETRIGALYLHKALDLLGRDVAARNATTEDDARRLIDYAALDVRRLGSIYEGLLEYQIEELIENGEPTLTLSKTRQARKASGSYYTPDYIVAYIVEQAVGPVLRERIQRFEDLTARLSARRTAFDRSRSVDARIALDAEIRQLEHDASEALLDLKVLDPAMGSGHFLVESVDFLTDRLIGVLQRYPNNPIFTRLADIRADIRASLAEQQIADEFIDDEQLSDARLLRRMVMKRCVYGVDLNDMAVELAKLSLWLHSFTVGAPLSFLDHHLRWGNSLIGARVQQVQQAMEGAQVGTVAEGSVIQGDIFGHNSAFAEMLNLASTIEHLVQIADANGQQVEQSAELYASYEQHVIPVKRLLDLWTSQFFGSKEAKQLVRLYSGSQQEVRDLVDALMGRRVLGPDDQRAVELSRELFTQHRFLHWDLDFPEVFIDLQRREWKSPEAAGFDAVVGNPPYLNAWTMTEIMSSERTVITSIFSKTELLEGHWDLYIPFIIQAINLCRKHGYHSFIVPNPVLREKYATALRKNLLSNQHIQSLLSFDEANVFDEVSRQCVVYVVKTSGSREDKQSIRVAIGSFQASYEEVALVESSVWLDAYNHQIRTESSYVSNIPILRKVEQMSDYLGQYLYINVGATVSSKVSGAFTKRDVITKTQIGNAKKFFDGADLSRWSINWKQVWLDYRRHEMSGPRTPEIFESRKILVRIRTGENEQLIAAYDDSSMYCDHTVIVCCSYDVLHGSNARLEFEGFEKLDLPIDHFYILSLLNSALITWVFRKKFATGALQGSFSDVWPQSVRSFPIRRINFTTPPHEREQLNTTGKALYQEFCEGYDAAPMLEFVDRCLPLLPDDTPDLAHEQSDVVHDLLALLAEQMIDLNQRKQAEAVRFIGWLENETGSRVEEWANKTAVQEYWAQEWSVIERAMQKNRGRFMHTQGLRGRDADAALEPLLRAVKPDGKRAVIHSRRF